MREKPTLVLLHGGPGFDHSIYKPRFSALADIAQVVLLEHRGNGRSDPGPREAWTLAQWSDDVHTFCEALGIAGPLVLGVSFGGTAALAYATRHPEHPAKLILVSTEAAGDTYRERRVALFERFGGPDQRGRAREEVSIIAALTLSPCRQRPGRYFSLRANENVTTTWLVPFLRALTRHLRGAFLVVWDRLPGHRAQVVTEYLHRPPRDVALLPPYAPELNPVEILWAYLNSNPLANFAASDAPHLVRVATRHAQRRPALLRSFFEATRPFFFSEIGHYLRWSQ